MKFFIMGLIISSSSLANVCSLSSGSYCEQVFVGTTQEQRYRPSRYDDGKVEVPVYKTECFILGALTLNGHSLITSGTAHEIFMQAKSAQEEGICTSTVPANCTVVSEKGRAIVAVNGTKAFAVERGTPAESVLEATKVIALLSIQNLCN